MRTAITLLMLGLLAGCVTQEQKTARAQQQVTEMIQTYGPACEKLGFQANTDQWRSCILNLDTKDNAEQHYPVTTSCFGPRGFVQCTTF